MSAMETSQQIMSATQTPHFQKSLDEKTNLEAESRLQSLGLAVVNGRPRFKVNDDTPMQQEDMSMRQQDMSMYQDDLQDFSMAKTDDSVSFTVLGKSSLCSIEASSLDSFVDIQQKVRSIDYNSMISSLNSNEINKKLTELLQENVKLKETLKQNNMAMKQQFNTLATWRELLMKVHQNHKEKFVETKKMINCLKQQNAELKLKLSRSYTDDDAEECEMIDNICVNGKHGNTEPVISGTEFYEKKASLSNDLNSSTVIYEKLPFDMKKLQNSTDSMNFAEKQKINNTCIDSTPIHSNKSSDFVMSNSLKALISNNISCDKCNAKDENIRNLNEFISLLEYKLKHAVALIQFCIKNSTNSGRYLPSIQKFNKELIDIFASEIEEFPVLREYLNDFVIQTLKEATFVEPDTSTNDSETCNLHNESFSKQQMSSNQNILSNKKKQETIKTENCDMLRNESRIFKCNLETSLDEISNLSISKNNVDPECSQAALIPETNCNKLLVHEKTSFEQEKELISAQRKSLEAEYKNIDNMKQLLQQEKISLNEEKMSLDQQSQLYEDQKKFIDLKCNQLAEQIKTLQEELRQKELDMKSLKNQVENCEVEKNLLAAQLKIYEEDFAQERKMKESFLEQKNKLDVDLQNQFEFNKQLQNEVVRLKTKVYNSGQRHDDTSPDLTPPEMSNLACPKCDRNFRDLLTLESHVETCLELI